MAKWRRREDIVGREAIDAEAKRVGVVKDLAWSPEGKLALVIDREKNEEAFLSFDQIEKIGDVVFIKSSSGLESIPMKICPTCKLKNPVDAKFCARCGKTLEESRP